MRAQASRPAAACSASRSSSASNPERAESGATSSRAYSASAYPVRWLNSYATSAPRSGSALRRLRSVYSRAVFGL